MKKSLLLIFLSIFSFATIHADITWTLSNDGILTISGKDMPNYDDYQPAPWYSQRDKIKEVIIENEVTNISHYAFYSCIQITSITIPNTVTNIGQYAFADCSGLTSITIPNSVKNIGQGAFASCSGLTAITIPNSVTNIEQGAFNGMPRLSSIKVEDGNTKYDSRNNCNAIIETESNTLLTGCKNTIIPNSVTNIGQGAFMYCSDLTSITIPSSVINIGKEAFYSCSRLASITIPNSVTSIGEYAFGDCSSLTTITLSSSVTSIEDGTFYGCSTLTSVIIPKSVTSIGDYAFRGCSKLISVTLPKSVTSIGISAFYGCSGLTSITIPESVTNIYHSAFKSCSGLTSITIPESVTSIGAEAFKACKGLISITCKANIPPYCDQDCFYNVKKSIPVYVPANSINSYKDANEWLDFTNIQPISVDPDLSLALTDVNTNLTEGYYKIDKVAYTRNNMSVGGYATFCLPFDIDLSNTTDNFSNVYVPLNISLCKPSGALFLLLDEVDSYSTIKAGQPFVAKCKTAYVTFKNSSEVSFEGTTSNTSTKSVKVYNFDGISGALTQKTDVYVKIGGTYSKLTGLNNSYYRAFFTNGSFGPTTNVNPFRMYVYKNDDNSLGTKITSISFDFNEVTTGIRELQMTNENPSVYDLNGRAVNEKNIKSGIYIKNGKKYIK